MKKLLALMAVGLIFATTAMDADAARRFGGGSSFGRSAPALRQANPAPSAPKLNQQAQRNPGAQAQNPAAAANAAKPSPWRGMLMGAAAALGITALLSALGLGEGFAQIIMMVLLAAALFFVFRLVADRFMAGKARPAAAGHSPSMHQSTTPQTEPEPVLRRESAAAAPTASAAGVHTMAGSVMDMFNQQAASSGEVIGAAIPEGFDKTGFEAVAKENFIKLQKAWDTGNVVEISDFTTNEFFIAVTHQLRERGAQAQTSEVIDLTAELLGILSENNEHVAVVEFNGAMKISGEFEEVHERWVLVRAGDDSTGWLLAGIEQVQKE